MRKIILENKTMEELREWFELNHYNSSEIKIGYAPYYCNGYQDADYYEIREVKPDFYNGEEPLYNLYG